ncbi:MAG TPA: hypothetical protein VNR39_20005 [Pseudolabrys sp.]|nr:hypothetical protein [Pseudolabrys sp.]
MSILLYVAGALFVAIGAAVIGFGIPINEFSFGNTLIIAGTVTVVGGLIVLALGVVVRELQYLADMYGRASVRAPKASDFDSPPRPMPPPPAARMPSPPRAAGLRPAEAPPQEPAVSVAPAPEPREEVTPVRNDLPSPLPSRRPVTTPVALPVVPPASRPAEELFGAPSLPNPAEIPDFDRSDRFRPGDVEAAEAAELAEAGEWDETAGSDEVVEVVEVDAVEAEPPVLGPTPKGATSSASVAEEKPEHSYFDAMWPADDEKPKAADVRSSRAEFAEWAPEPPVSQVEQEEPPAEEEARTVPILKSGVVDGMGYTLYVDGSIEAELPQGTLRFASINELRAHLERTS